MNKIDVKIKADIPKVMDLYHNEILSRGETKDMLNQFSKNDLVNTLLTEDEDLEEDIIEEEIQEQEVEEEIPKDSGEDSEIIDDEDLDEL